jgi:hypothetical protein
VANVPDIELHVSDREVNVSDIELHASDMEANVPYVEAPWRVHEANSEVIPSAREKSAANQSNRQSDVALQNGCLQLRAADFESLPLSYA